ncbi:MAG: WD40 repeat domain-containing protein, partial [Planctomycetota bacterium]
MISMLLGTIVSIGFAIEARRSADEARWQSYVANVAAAIAALEAGETRETRRRLEAAPAALRGWEWHHIDAALDDSEALLRGHESWVEAVAFDPTGRLLASAAKEVHLRDAATTRVTRVLPGHDKGVMCIAFAPAGGILASGGHDAVVRLWDTETGTMLRTLEGHRHAVFDLAINPDGIRLVSVTSFVQGVPGRTDPRHELPLGLVPGWPWLWRLCVWELPGGRPLLSVPLTRGAHAVAISPDGRLVASGGRDSTISIRDLETGRLLHTFGRENREVIFGLAFDPSGAQLASTSGNGHVRLWDVGTGASLWHLESPPNPSKMCFDVAFAPDGSWLAVACRDGSVRRIDARSGHVLDTLRGHQAWTRTVAVSPDGRSVASGSDDQTVRLWTPGHPAARIVVAPPGDGWEFTAARTSGPKDSRTVSVQMDGALMVWDALEGVPIAVRSPPEGVKRAAGSPDGALVAAVLGDDSLVVWSTATDTALWRSDEGYGNGLSFSADGMRLATGAWNGTVHVRDAATGALIASLREPSGASVGCTALDAAGTRLATAGRGFASIWDVDEQRLIRTMPVDSPQVPAIVFSRDGSMIAAATWT